MPRRYTPAASRTARAALAGAAWSIAGIVLISFAAGWLGGLDGRTAVAFGVTGLVSAVLAWLLFFRRLAGRNLERLTESPERACVFGFQPVRSHLVMVSMIALGSVLRHSALPKSDLAVVYLAIGGALLLSSFRYHARVARTFKGVGL